MSEEAERYKVKGNEELKNGQFEAAIKEYNKAISLDGENAVYFSNRSAAWAELSKWENSLNDASKCIDKDARFIKGYSRKGTALLNLRRIEEARTAFREGLLIDSNNAACKQGMAATVGLQRTGGIMESITKVANDVRKMFSSNGRVQTYAMVLVIYVAYTYFTNSGSTRSASNVHDGERRYAFVEMASGSRQRISFTTQGTGPGVLLLHQPGLSYGTEMLPILQKLSKHMHVLAVDFPCNGDSDCLAQDVSMTSILSELSPVWSYPTYTVVASGASCRYIPELNANKIVLLNPTSSYPAKAKTLPQIESFLHGLEKSDVEEEDLTLQLIQDASKFFSSSKFEKPSLPPNYLTNLDIPHLWLAEDDVGATPLRTFISVHNGKWSMLDESTQDAIVSFVRPPVKDEDEGGHSLD